MKRHRNDYGQSSYGSYAASSSPLLIRGFFEDLRVLAQARRAMLRKTLKEGRENFLAEYRGKYPNAERRDEKNAFARYCGEAEWREGTTMSALAAIRTAHFMEARLAEAKPMDKARPAVAEMLRISANLAKTWQERWHAIQQDLEIRAATLKLIGYQPYQIRSMIGPLRNAFEEREWEAMFEEVSRAEAKMRSIAEKELNGPYIEPERAERRESVGCTMG